MGDAESTIVAAPHWVIDTCTGNEFKHDHPLVVNSAKSVEPSAILIASNPVWSRERN